MAKHPITVEGVILPEFIKDKEILKDVDARNRLFSEANDRVYPRRNGRPKFKEKK